MSARVGLPIVPRIALLLLALPLLVATDAAEAQLRAEANVYAVRLAMAPDLERAPVALRQPVTVRMRRVTVDRALREITQKASISLAYSRAVVELDRVVSIDLENGSVLEALHTLFGQTDLELWVTGDGRMALVPGNRESASATSVAEQAATITGLVSDAAIGQPLSGATVAVRGTTIRSVTNVDGRYTLPNVPAGRHVLDVQRLGFRRDSSEVTVSEDAQTLTVDFQLVRQALTLEGVVTIGYGTQQAERLTGAVSTVDSEQFNAGRVISAEELIQGKVAGLQVANSGEPGGGMSIRIRGGTSVNASNEPLFVVDGLPLPVGGGLSSGRNPLNFLNPDDIANVTVLKDASATAIYGSRGANGVILVETKSGRTVGPEFTYSTSISGSEILAAPEMLTTEQFRAAVQANAPSRLSLLGTANTDWRDAVLRNAGGQEHNLSVVGASEAMNYRLSLGWLEQSGVVRGSETDRVSAALNYGHRLFSDRLSLNSTLRGARTDDQYTPGGGLGAATVFDPTQSIMSGSDYFEHLTFPLSVTNPLAELAAGVDEGTTFRGIGSLEARYATPFIEALSATARLGFDVANSERRTFYPSTLFGQSRSATPGFMNRSNPRETTSLIESFLTYSTSSATLRGDVDATAGYSYELSRGDYPYFEARGLSTDLLGPSGVPAADEIQPRLFVREGRLASFFGRVNYTFADKYTAMLSIRRDGSSKFAPGKQWGTFPAAALAWRVSEEGFMDDVTLFSDLKLRFSWGMNGNQSVGDYLWVPSYLYGDGLAQVQFGSDFVTTIRPSAVDPDIKWEETTSYNLGADFGLFSNRLTGSLEYYVKDTDDLLFAVPVAAGTFVSNFVTTNVGDMRNKGIELTLNTHVLEPANPRGLRWMASLNAARNSNELLTVNPFGNGGEQILVGGIAGGVGSNIQVLQPGYPVNSFFVYKHKRDANGKPVVGPTDLDRYEDLNGDNVINQSDRRAFESPAPDWILGHTSMLGWRNFDASFSLRAQLGNHVYNNLASSQGFYDRLSEAAGPVNLHASVLEYGFVTPQYFSDVYVEDASFLRLDNLSIGYTVPRFRNAEHLRIFGTVQNAFTLSGYSGPDPMAGLNGIDNNIYPRSRTFSAGVTVGF